MSGTDHRRRLLAILAADAAGYSRLMAADEAATVVALDAARAVFQTRIESNQGRVIDMAGDSVLAVFELATGAVTAALAIQDELIAASNDVPDERRMRFRIGVHLGEIIEKADGTIYGDGVNIAARLGGLAEQGGITVSESVRTAVKGKVAARFEDQGEQTVKNISEPVRAYRVRPEGGGGAAVRPAESRRTGIKRAPAIAAAALIVIIALAGLAWLQPWVQRGQPPSVAGTTQALPEKPAVAPVADKPKAPPLSIVVLPFDNLSDDKSQGYFADGITEDLITDLSRIRGAFVISRGTSFTYKGKAVDAKAVAKDLNVRYVLEGSVRRAGDQVRVNAQLIDGETGSHIWSDRFDRKVEDVFSLQNEVTGRLASVLKGELLEVESQRARQGRPANLAAWDYALEGWVNVYVIPQQTDQTLHRAKSLFEKALELDPDLGMAWIGLARFHYHASTVGIKGIPRTEARSRLLETAAKAVSISPNDPDAQAVQGLAYRINRFPAKGLSACQAALKFNPNHEEANVCAGLAKVALGRNAEAFPYFDKAARLNPNQRPFRLMFFQAVAHLTDGQHDEAANMARKSIASNPKFPSSHFVLTSALAWSGDMKAARAELADFLKRDDGRNSTIAGLSATFSYMSPNFDHVLEGLRRAGMPEK